MHRSLLLVVSACFALAAGCAQSPQAAAPQPAERTDNRPNIVLIMADDMGYGDLACYGSEIQHTPNIDALAARGTRFTDYHSNGACCSPTRAALMTGRYQQRCGVEGVVTAANHRETGMPLEEITVAEVLRDAGYRTAMFGKWHLGYDPRFNPIHQGFETFEGFVSGNIDYVNKIDQAGYADWWVGDELEFHEGYLTELIADRAADYIARHADEPFFLYLPHGAPHYPLQGPNDPGFREVGVGPVRDPNARRDQQAAYHDVIAALDESVGRVVAALEENGIADNTLIIFTSDNGQAGSMGSAGPFRGRKGTVYEGGHRVPMIMCWPDVMAAGRVESLPVIGMDLMPTFISIGGAVVPPGLAFDGMDLTAYHADDDGGRILHFVHNNDHAMRMSDWKLVMRGNNAPELYNLRDDPGEQNDVASEHPDLVGEMRAAHQAWLAETRTGVAPVSGR